MFKKLTLSLFVLIMTLSPTKASEEELLNLSVRDNPIIINDKSVSFYPTFVDNTKALESINIKYQNLITELNGTTELNESNVQVYYNSALGKLNEGVANAEILEFYTKLEGYLMKYENEKIKNLCNKYLISGEDSLLQEIDLLTPYTSDKLYSRPSSYRSFNVSNAVAYAVKYATNPNPAYDYYSDGGDCTNFASQIVLAGGIPEYNTGNFETGWYNGSASWIRANRFANWYGIWNSSKKHSWFSYNASVGDFVALDYSSNGSWDHIGFIVGKDDYYGDYTDSYGIKSNYKDYKVAQHSTDMNAWASSNTCSWEEAWYKKAATYGIVLTPQ